MPAAPASSTLLRTAFFASAILLTAFSAEAIAQTSGCVEGTVTDYLGVPIPETTVRLAPPDPLRQVPEVVTDDKGRFEIDDLEPGTYKAYASNSTLGYVRPDSTVFRPGLPAVSVPAGSCVNLTIDAGAPVGHLMLSGRDAASCEPPGSMVITMARPGHAAARRCLENAGETATHREQLIRLNGSMFEVFFRIQTPADTICPGTAASADSAARCCR